MRGDDGQVYANIAQPGEGVIGVLYRCREALARLDVFEEGYDRRQVQVTSGKRGDARSNGLRRAAGMHDR